MRSYNVIQAANYIGCDPKTVRRWLKRGRLTAERTDRGWLAIPGGQVEYAKIQWEKEQEQFAGPGMPKAVQDSASGQHKDMVDRVRRLESTVVSLSATVEALEQRIASIEARLSKESLDVPTVPADSSPEPTLPKSSSPSLTPPDLPLGTLTSAQFRVQLGIDKPAMDTYIQRGIYGESLPMTRIPHPTRAGYTLTYFTPSQRQAAIELLRRHGKL
jgi:hypothetical protein